MRYTSNYYAKLPRKDWGGALTGASSGFKLGASIGSVFGPIGSGVAGAIGAITGGLFGNRAENRAKRKLAQQQREISIAKNKALEEEKRIAKANLYRDDLNYLNTIELNDTNSLFMKKGGWIQKATKGKIYDDNEIIPTYMKRNNGRAVSAKGINLGQGDKLLTNSRGTISGSHETGQNIPIKRKGRVVAVAEPGEVLVNDTNMPITPFVLSKRIGRNGRSGVSFAEEYMQLESMKNGYNSEIIDGRQAELIKLNNSVAPTSKKAKNGLALGPTPINIAVPRLTTTPGIQPYRGTIGKSSRNEPWGAKALTKIGKLADSGGLNTILGAAGTVGNILMTNKTLNRQSDLIKSNLTEALAYNPTYNKNYLFDDTLNVQDQVSAVNQGYASSIGSLSTIDPAIASALKSNANLSRTSALQGIYGERNRGRIGIRNQNVSNIMATNASNANLSNQTALMKLNAKISANEQLGDLEAARLANFQGAVGELNNVLYNREAIKSINTRYKDTIGDSYMKCGGKIGRKKRRIAR